MGMEFEIISIFNRSVTIERKNEECYEAGNECRVKVNGTVVKETRQNVITIDNLLPDTEYEIELCGQDGSAHKKITTKHESFLLNVRDFGAKGDGSSIDTAAIQAAVMACPVEGTVYFPAGTYFTGPVFLKSKMTLWVDEGATILGDPDRTHYPVLPGMVRHLYRNEEEYNIASWEGNPLNCFASLITAINVEDVDLIGRGTIDGNASNSDWWENVRKKRGAWRPKTVFFSGCQRIRMQSLTVKNSPSWTLHPYYSDHLQFLNLTVWNPADSPNTDGFDPESCEDVLLLGTKISVGDDCVAIKSGKLYMAAWHYKRTKGIEIRNCLFERGHGSVTVGSEVAGGVEDIHISRCIFLGTDRGVRIKTRRGRGERSVITGMVFENIRMDKVHMPVTVNMFYFCDPDGHTEYVQGQDFKPVDYRTPKIGTITVKDVVCTGVDASFVCAYGLPEAPIERIEIENAQVSYLTEGERAPQRPIMMDNFPPISGRSLVLKNVKEVICKNVTVTGSVDDAPELNAVEKQDTAGLKLFR